MMNYVSSKIPDIEALPYDLYGFTLNPEYSKMVLQLWLGAYIVQPHKGSPLKHRTEKI